MLEVRRQLFHLFLGLIIAFFVSSAKSVLGNLIVFAIILVVSILLVFPELKIEIDAINLLLKHFERPHDIEKFPFKGSIFYGIGVAFPILLLDVKVACAIIAVLSAGDSMSTLIGRFYGTTRRGHRSFEGMFAFIIFSFMAASMFVSLKLAFAFALVGGLIEFFSFFDDNFLVPVGLTLVYFFYIYIVIPYNLIII